MRLWLRLRDAFWFLPAVLCVVAVLLAEGVMAIDRAVRIRGLVIAPIINEAGASGSRDLLGAIASSMLGVASTTFSITMAVLALTSSSYGPRLVRNFMADRGNQLVLGTFLATFLYALLVLRAVRSDSDAASGQPFVPHLAVNVAVLLAVLSIAVLVYFIHHISDSIQVATLSGRVRGELQGTVDRLYPTEAGRSPTDVGDARGEPPADLSVATAVRAGSDGYVVAVDLDRLVGCAVDEGLVIVLTARPGDHVLEDDVVARVWPPTDDEQVQRTVRRAVTVGRDRTPYQDVAFAVQQLVELAVRALSPGTNDPFTAQNALDDLKVGLAAMASRPTPSAHRYDDGGRLRVVAEPVPVESLIAQVMDAMRTYALAAPDVLVRTLDVAEAVGLRAVRPDVVDHLQDQVRLLAGTYAASEPPSYDRHRVAVRADAVVARLSDRRPTGRSAG